MIVVLGATGNIGRPLVQALVAAGGPVTAVARNITEADVPGGAQPVAADLTAPASLPAVFDGGEALFLLLTGAGAYEVDVPLVLETAKASGIGRVVAVSSQGVLTRPQSASHGVVMQRVEDAVTRSGMDWTILRPGGFASNAYAWAETVRQQRSIAAPFGDIGLPLVHPDDIAAVAAVALTQDGHVGQAYVLTGPEMITPRQQAEVISDALGEAVDFVEVTREVAREHMLAFMPQGVVDTTLDVLGQPTAAEQRVSADVQQVLGRPPRTFADWASGHIAAFR